jgi:uncharacterized membrane protein YqjE
MSDGDIPVVERPASGLFHSLRQLVATVLALVHTRLELATTELQEEVQRATSLLLWSVIGLLGAVLGLFFIGMTIIIAFWDGERLLAAILVTVGFVLIAVIGATIVIVKFRNKPRVLAATRAELGKDRAELEGRS